MDRRAGFAKHHRTGGDAPPVDLALHAFFPLVSGAVVHLDASCYQAGPAARIVITGSKGIVHVDLEGSAAASYLLAAPWSPNRFAATWHPVGLPDRGADHSDDPGPLSLPRRAVHELIAWLEADRRMSTLDQACLAEEMLGLAIRSHRLERYVVRDAASHLGPLRPCDHVPQHRAEP